MGPRIQFKVLDVFYRDAKNDKALSQKYQSGVYDCYYPNSEAWCGEHCAAGIGRIVRIKTPETS